MRLRHYLYIVSLVALSACNSEELNTSDTTDGEIRLSAATIGGNTAVTTRTTTSGELKAFTTGTKIALQVSGTWTKESSSETVVKTPTATAAASITTANSLTLNPALYWDDFGTADPNNKDTGRANGLTIFGVACDGETTAPTVSDWTSLTWDLGDDQSSGISANDLLLSNNVSGANAYKFDSRTEDGKQLEFYHALSKITVNIKAGEGFTDNKFTNDPVVVLTSNEANSTTNTEWAYTKGIFNVTTGELSLEDTDLNTVTMAQAGTNGNTVTMEALVMPGSIFASDAATIMRINADGNIYYITAAKIRTAIKSTHENDGAYETEAGKNYIFKVIVNKTGVTVTATVKDWDIVDSEEETPAISFTADVTSSTNTTTGSSLSSGTFRLWKTSAFTETALAAAKTTTVTYDGNSTYTYNPTLYWQSAKDDSYFRALATMTTTESGTPIAAITDETATDKTVSQGTDLLWGTTDKHTGTYSGGSKEYAEGDPINPRTTEVPLIFKHAMSKVVVNLQTVSGDAAVVLTDATVTLTNLATAGTISLESGIVKASSTKADKAVDAAEKASYSNLIMVPQGIGDTSKLIITLDDDTTYSLLLKDCKDEKGNYITEWKSGNMYTYTITLKKQEISFRAMVQDWTENKGNGNATLDWD